MKILCQVGGPAPHDKKGSRTSKGEDCLIKVLASGEVEPRARCDRQRRKSGSRS